MAAALGVLAALHALVSGGVALDADVAVAVRATRVDVAAGSFPASGESRSSGQLELVPRVALGGDEGVRFAIEYAPRLLLPVDLAAGAPELTDRTAFEARREYAHRGRISVEESFRIVRLAARGDVTYGETDPLRGAWTAQPVRAGGRIRTLDGRAAATASASPSRRLGLSAEVGTYRSGGADAAAQLALPAQRGLLAGMDLGWSASRRDRLTAGVAATLARTADTDAAHARAAVGWTRSASRTATARLGAGLAASRTSPANGEEVIGLSPWAEAGLERAADGGRLGQRLSLRAEPGIDAVTGEVQQRVEARGSLSWRANEDLTLTAEGGAAAARRASGGFDVGLSNVVSRLASAAARAERRIGPGARLAAGAWVRWQESRQPGVPSFREWGGLLELSYDLSPR